MSQEQQKVRKIVVFEDDPTFRSSYVSALEGRGFEVKVIDNPLHMNLDELKAFGPSLISLDFNMPGKNGVDVLQEFRKDNVFLDTPFIFVTSQAGMIADELKRLNVKKIIAKYETPITDIVNYIDNLI